MKILEIGVDFDGGGIDRYMYNNCTRIKDIEFDFVIVQRSYDGVLEPIMKSLGYTIYKVPRLMPTIMKNYTALKRIMEANKYDAVHVHLGYKGIIALLCAKRCGIKTRIVHSHLAYVPMSKLSDIVRRLVTPFTKRLATNYAACGEDAGRWMWGEKELSNGKVKLLNNAIPTKDFAYSEEKRASVRRELNLEGKFVVGHVGRLSDQKNHLFLLEIFSYIVKKKENAMLLLVGDGELEDELKRQAKKLGIINKVLFLGVRDDVSRLYNAIDVFVFPSKYEGLPFTLIEAQCNGVMSICSDVITEKVRITDTIQFVSLGKTADDWADIILQTNISHDKQAWMDVAKAGYDLDIQAEELKEYYLSCIRKNN